METTKQIKPTDKVTFKLIVTIRQFVNSEQNLVCYDGLIGEYPTLAGAVMAAKELRKQQDDGKGSCLWTGDYEPDLA